MALEIPSASRQQIPGDTCTGPWQVLSSRVILEPGQPDTPCTPPCFPVGRVRPCEWRQFRCCFPANLGSSLLTSRPVPERGQR